MKNQLRIHGWPAVHRELARLEEQNRLGYNKPIAVLIEFSNGNHAEGVIEFAQSNEEYLVLKTDSGLTPFARYRIIVLTHDCTCGSSMTQEKVV